MNEIRRENDFQTETETETDIDAPEKKVLIKKQLKTKLFESMRATPIHGIPFMVDSKTWYMKLFWILFFSAFAGFGTWLIIKAILDYFEYPVVTVINKKFELSPEFPAVTICNLDPLVSNFASFELQNKLPAGFNIDAYEGTTASGEKYKTFNKLEEVRRFVTNSLSDPKFGFKNKQKYGYKL